MRTPLQRGEFDLAVALGVAGAILLAAAVVAALAGDAFAKLRRQAAGGSNRAAAGAAEPGLAGLQPMGDRNALVEDETFALPEAIFGRHFLQIFQDAAP